MRKLIIAAVAALALLSAPAAAGVATAAPAATCASASTSDSLYVGDNSDNSVKRFDAATGCYQGVFVPSPPSGVLAGPRGIIRLPDGNFLVSNQNIGLPTNGAIDEYRPDGELWKALVPGTDPNAPYDPDGIILGPDKTTLYVADIGDCTGCAVGRVATYNVNTGKFLRNLDFSSFINNTAINPTGVFNPRGLVFGPDGLLYVSVFDANPTERTLGWILSYNTYTGAVRVVASSTSGATDCSTELHKPDGLTFGPDGKLYVTSFVVTPTDPIANPADIDRILIFNAATGACTGEIDLDQVGQNRAYAQYILFGPRGYLFVPITGDPGDPPNAGAVRRYDVRTKTVTNFIAPSPEGPLGSAYGLTFGRTNPTTLAYQSF
jgi:sugar lactone lactonase YvrE